MKVEVTSFRGEVPRLTPRALPANAAQSAINARLLSGDLEAWRQFTLTHALVGAYPVESVYLLNDAWLSWRADVDAARGAIPGDQTFRLYLTGPDLYTEPRFTNYALATTGAEPYPVTTRPLGVPGPDSVPLVALGVDSTPTTFSVDTLDDDASLATSWTVNPPLSSGGRVALVTQGSGFYLATYDENRDPGQEAYANRNFGVSGVTVLQVAVDFLFAGDTSYRQASMIVGAGSLGDGVGIVYDNGTLSIRKPSQWGVNFFTAVLGTVAMTALSAGVTYSLNVTVVTNSDGTKTVTASIRDGGSAELATLTLTNNFSDGDFCGFANGAISDSGSTYQTRYSNYHVQASGNTGVVPANIATSYVYTFVNDLGEESAPSEPSATVVRPDGVSATVTTPTGVPSSASGYAIQTKRIYRAATGNTGTEFRFVAEIPLGQADYVDVLTDVQLGEVIESTDWDLPPDDLRGILALPNGIMVGFRRNQLCFSAQNRPHAWPVVYRLNTDTDIVGIGNIDTTVVIGTEAFPYLAIGSDPAAYSMTKLEVPQACVSKRSFAYLTNIGVVFASPDGLIAVAGSGQVRNLTEKVFTRKQWQALNPPSILGVAHDDVYHFWYDNTGATDPALLSIEDVSGLVVDGSLFPVSVDRTGNTDIASVVTWTATGTGIFNGTQGFKRDDDTYTGTLSFAAGETFKILEFTLEVTDGTTFDATVTLSLPSDDTEIVDGVGAMTASGSPPATDPFWANVLFLHHYDDVSTPTVFTDVQGIVWTNSGGGGVTGELTQDNTTFQSPKFGSAGDCFVRNLTGFLPFISHAYANVPLDGSGQNKFTLESWFAPSTFGLKRVELRTSLGENIFIQLGSFGTVIFAGTFTTGTWNIIGPVLTPGTWGFVEGNYDGTKLRLFLNGVLVGSATLAPGTAKLIDRARIGMISSSPGDWNYFDETRATLGVCRHPSDASYSPPTAPFPDS